MPLLQTRLMTKAHSTNLHKLHTCRWFTVDMTNDESTQHKFTQASHMLVVHCRHNQWQKHTAQVYTSFTHAGGSLSTWPMTKAHSTNLHKLHTCRWFCSKHDQWQKHTARSTHLHKLHTCCWFHSEHDQWQKHTAQVHTILDVLLPSLVTHFRNVRSKC